MRVVLSCIGKFHHFDLARQLHARALLATIYTSYPRWKLRSEGLPPEKIRTFPWLHAPFMARAKFGLTHQGLARTWERLARHAHDRWVARQLTPCDVLVGLSGHNLRAGRRAQALGAAWICDRGSTHIQNQDTVLRAEHARLGLPFDGIPADSIAQEKAEYAGCDLVTVPSRYVRETFLAQGLPAEKIGRVPYGVDLSRFHPVDQPPADEFRVIYVGAISARKGIACLVEAFRALRHPRKSLTLVGGLDPAFAAWFSRVQDSDIRYLGALPQAELKRHLSRAHVFALASLEEGLALVQAQAMACGCPLVISEATGGADLLSGEGVEGLVFPVNQAPALTAHLQALADDPARRQRMSAAALARVQAIGGWSDYGEAYVAQLHAAQNLASKHRAGPSGAVEHQV
jgi:alpha-maltose-1-phosphate synthase